MTAIEAARKVTQEKQCHLLRPRKGEAGQYDVKPIFTGNKRGWFYLDLFTASHIVMLHDNLSKENRAKYAGLGSVKMMASLAFRLLK